MGCGSSKGSQQHGVAEGRRTVVDPTTPSSKPSPAKWDAFRRQLAVTKSKYDSKRRDKFWDVLDKSRQGSLAFAEIEKEAIKALPPLGGLLPPEQLKPILLRAFNATKRAREPLRRPTSAAVFGTKEDGEEENNDEEAVNGNNGDRGDPNEAQPRHWAPFSSSFSFGSSPPKPLSLNALAALSDGNLASFEKSDVEVANDEKGGGLSLTEQKANPPDSPAVAPSSASTNTAMRRRVSFDANTTPQSPKLPRSSQQRDSTNNQEQNNNNNPLGHTSVNMNRRASSSVNTLGLSPSASATSFLRGCSPSSPMKGGGRRNSSAASPFFIVPADQKQQSVWAAADASVNDRVSSANPLVASSSRVVAAASRGGGGGGGNNASASDAATPTKLSARQKEKIQNLQRDEFRLFLMFLADYLELHAMFTEIVADPLVLKKTNGGAAAGKGKKSANADIFNVTLSPEEFSRAVPKLKEWGVLGNADSPLDDDDDEEAGDGLTTTATRNLFKQIDAADNGFITFKDLSDWLILRTARDVL